MATRTRTNTRERILETAERLILTNGYAATSVDRIITGVGITKGAFFYHFKTKNDMARALIRHYADLDLARLDEYATRAWALSSDPLQSLLVFIGLYQEMVAGMTDENPGCLFASFCYESGQFDDEVLQTLDDVIIAWRERIADWLREAAAAHPPVRPVDLDSLADMLTVVFEGAFVVARSTRSPGVFAEQLQHYRQYLELLFDA